MNFKESEEWQEDELFPAILAICEDKRTQKKLNRQMRHILDEQWDEGLVFAATTVDKLQQATKPTNKLWLRVHADEQPTRHSLATLFAS